MIFSPCSNLLCGLITTENLTKKPPQKLHKISPYARDALAQPALSKSLLNADREGAQAHFSAVFALPALQRCPVFSAASGTSVVAPPLSSVVPPTPAPCHTAPVSCPWSRGSLQPLHKRADGFLFAGISLPSRDSR